MAGIYGLFFQEILPRVFLQMKKILHLSPNKRIGDWFLTEFEIIIRLYGFIHQPYILPAFLTVRVFSLELVTKRLTVEEEYIPSFRKISRIKFPWKVGPCTIKSRAALPLADNLLRNMGFLLGQSINYDPHQVISKRRHTDKNNPFKHTEVAGLREAANWDDYPKHIAKDVSMEQNSTSSLPRKIPPP